MAEWNDDEWNTDLSRYQIIQQKAIPAVQDPGRRNEQYQKKEMVRGYTRN